jgi:hypothetical protein
MGLSTGAIAPSPDRRAWLVAELDVLMFRFAQLYRDRRVLVSYCLHVRIEHGDQVEAITNTPLDTEGG